MVAEWMVLERRCCPFFEFAASVGGSDRSIQVALTGSPEVKQLLKSELGSFVVSPSTPVRATQDRSHRKRSRDDFDSLIAPHLA